jgi:hypothetical protein
MTIFRAAVLGIVIPAKAGIHCRYLDRKRSQTNLTSDMEFRLVKTLHALHPARAAGDVM